MTRANLCPACGPGRFQVLFRKLGRDYRRCRKCGLIYVSPFPTSQEIKKFYRAGYWDKKGDRSEKVTGYISYQREKKSHLANFRAVFDQVAKNYPGLDGRVLDIGCSWGLFLSIAKKAGWEIYGVDLSTEAVKKARRELGVKTIYNQPLQQVEFPANSFDLVTCFQAIEHLTELEGFLEETKRVLKPGGVVVVTTPNAGGWQARLMGKRWLSYRHPDHLLFFNFRNLSCLLEKAGFIRIRRLKDPPRLYRLDYLIEISHYYHRIKILSNITKLVGLIVRPAGGVKIPVPLGSLVVTAQKSKKP